MIIYPMPWIVEEKKKISEPIWQYVEVGKGRCEFNLFLELKRFSDA